MVPFFFFFSIEKIPRRKASCNPDAECKVLPPVSCEAPSAGVDWGRGVFAAFQRKQGRELLINMLQLLLGCCALAKEGGRHF